MTAQPTSIRLPVAIKKRLARYAATDSRPVSVEIVWILEKYADRRDAEEGKK